MIYSAGIRSKNERNKHMKIFINNWPLLVCGQFLLCGCGKNEFGIAFGTRDQPGGLRRIDNGDGRTMLTNVFGSECRLLEKRPETYLYLQVAPACKKRMPMN